MPQTRAQQRAREEQGQAVTPPQQIPNTTTTRRRRRARAQPAPTNVSVSQSEIPVSFTPVVPAVPKVREHPKVPEVRTIPSKGCVVTVFGKEHKLGEGTFTLNVQSDSSAYLRAAQQADASVADPALESSPHNPVGSGSPAVHSTNASPIQQPVVTSTQTVDPSPQPDILIPLQDTASSAQDNGEETGDSAAATAQVPALFTLASPPAGYQTLTSRVPHDPARGESKVVTISVLDGRTMTMSIPEKQLENLFDYLVKMYGAVEKIPELTSSTGKRRATEDLEDTRPARKVRIDGALTGEVLSVDRLPSHLNLCYQPKQGDATHSQKYRMIVPPPKQGNDYPVVIPTYDDQGYNTGSKIFVPVQGDEDDTDLDSELDAASSSFKENLPSEQELGQTEEVQAPQALIESSSIDIRGPEGSVQVAQEAAGNLLAQPEVPTNPLDVPETPNNRG